MLSFIKSLDFGVETVSLRYLLISLILERVSFVGMKKKMTSNSF